MLDKFAKRHGPYLMIDPRLDLPAIYVKLAEVLINVVSQGLIYLRECSKSHIYREFSVLQKQATPSFCLRIFMAVDQCKSALSVIRDGMKDDLFGTVC